MCHWQLAARRSRIFILMLSLLGVIAGLAYIAHSQFGVMREAAYALVGGIGMLPMLGTVLVLILLESESLNQARQARLPDWVARRFGPAPQGG